MAEGFEIPRWPRPPDEGTGMLLRNFLVGVFPLRPEIAATVALFLCDDVRNHSLEVRTADAEGTVPFLPAKALPGGQLTVMA